LTAKREPLRWAVAAVLAVVLALAGCAQTPLPGAPAGEPLRSAASVQANHLVVTVRNKPWAPNPYAASTGRGYGGQGVYRAGALALGAARRLAAGHGLTEVASWPIELLGVHCLVFATAPGTSREAVLAALRSDPDVESVQPLMQFELRSPRFNDPYAHLQANLGDLGVSAAQQWSRGEGVRIAVIDTGVDTLHPDFGGRLARVRDFVADGRSPAEHHGTAVAGVIAAVPDNGIGIAGIAPAATVFSLRACWTALGGAGACNSFTLAQALSAAAGVQAGVVNLSLGGPTDPLLARLVERLLARGVVVVGAVPVSGRREGFPTGIEGVIAVDASTPRPPSPRVLYAPGSDVFTLTPAGRYDVASGSSMAAAEVSGVAALLLAARPKLKGADIELLLSRSAAGGSPAIRPGGASVNACAALQSLNPDAVCAEVSAMRVPLR
jgi:subtilisin family serine protease